MGEYLMGPRGGEGRLLCDGFVLVVAVHAANRPRMLLPVDWRPALDGDMMPLAAARVSVGVSLETEGDIRGWTSSNDLDGYFESVTMVAVAADGGMRMVATVGPILSDIERRLRARRDDDGDDLGGGVISVGVVRSSSGITYSASVRRALSRLLTGTMVWIDCSDSAMDTGREVRVVVVAPARMV